MQILFTLRPEIFSILIMLLLIIYDRYCARFRNERDEYLRFALVCLAHCIMALVTEITVNLDTVPKTVNDVCHVMFFLFSLLYSGFYLEYALKQVLPKGKRRRQIMGVGNVLILAAIVIMVFSPIYYLQGENTRYSAGIGPTLCFALGFIFIVGADVILVICRKRVNDTVLMMLLPLSTITMGLLVMQICIPEFLCTAQALTLTAVGMFFVVENPVSRFRSQAFIDHNTQVEPQRLRV